mgnify:CR=1 FL=1
MSSEPREVLELEPEGTPLDAAEFIVVDVETTGSGSSSGDRVTEVAAVLVRGNTVSTVFDTLVNPMQPISEFVTRLTGISNAMVRTAPRFSDIAGELASQLAGRVFVAHNALFDWRFLDSEFLRVTSGGLDALSPSRLCTVRLSKLILRHLPRRNLDSVCAHYGIAIENRHRAGGDAVATAHVLIGLIRDAERAGIWSLEGLIKYGSQRRKRVRRTAMPSSTDGAEGA